ncbi:uncharacterized protein N7479_005177 [Penicillium vulpinum]|uniref:uncharacterized protein n=1 Tax=Penicillium vulpinum TaxID=29845 RepID=UPI0025470D04|nr:uncharacterized protein N7479_005177 [Penicillium vulpinum]KAJ5958027.1 hypothetical protein N7479_005177 [Penicillium vulpinum]
MHLASFEDPTDSPLHSQLVGWTGRDSDEGNPLGKYGPNVCARFTFKNSSEGRQGRSDAGIPRRCHRNPSECESSGGVGMEPLQGFAQALRRQFHRLIDMLKIFSI